MALEILLDDWGKETGVRQGLLKASLPPEGGDGHLRIKSKVKEAESSSGEGCIPDKNT